MIDDADDDIPVLTQILRTGSGRTSSTASSTASSIASSTATLAGSGFPPHLDGRLTDPTSTGDPLVIGNEAQVDAVVGDALAAPFDDDEAHDPARYTVGDETLPDDRSADSFALSQDHDPAGAADAPATRFDEPGIDDAFDRPTLIAVAGPVAAAPERRVHPFVLGEPRERRLTSDDVSLQRLASITSSVRDSVLVALQTRIDTELDARIAQAMHREVETAVAQLQDKLRDGLTEALRDVVARAVDDEMTRFVTAEREAAARLDPRKPPTRLDG